jgi:hypothetical protein
MDEKKEWPPWGSVRLKRGREMKRLMVLAMVIGLLGAGCAVRKHCFIYPPLNQVVTVTTGSDLVFKAECLGKLTVNDCTGMGLIYLGKSGNNLRIQGKVSVVTNVRIPHNQTGVAGVVEAITIPQYAVYETPILTEALYPENSKLILFQDVKIEVIKADDNQITSL